MRTPMGGGRGYGPTHSQNLEKHLVGVPGLRVLVLHRRAPIASLYRALRHSVEPTLIIENKLLYRERADAVLPPTYELMETAGVPLVPGYHGAAQDLATLAREAERIGYPVLIKASAGGGGKGMRVVESAPQLESALASAKQPG